jgi:hypothetical protein
VLPFLFLDPVGRSDHCVLSFTLKCYLNYENTKIEKFNYFKGDYDKLRQELDIDWNEILNDKNTTDMIDILLTYDQKCLLFDFAVSAICFSRFFRSLVIIDFVLFRALVYSL